MRHRNAHRKLSRNTSHRRAMLRNMVTDLLDHGRLMTTLPKAKEVRPLAEKMITLGKRDSLHARRQVQSYVMKEAIAKKVFDTIAPKFADRKGGYSRIIKLGNRKGDGADLAIIELLGSELEVKKAERAAEAQKKSGKKADKKGDKKGDKKPAKTEKGKKAGDKKTEEKKPEAKPAEKVKKTVAKPNAKIGTAVVETKVVKKVTKKVAPKKDEDKVKKEKKCKALNNSRAKSAKHRPSGAMLKKWRLRNVTRVLEAAVAEQFEKGRLFAKVATSPGQIGSADGYILEGEELAFYVKKMQAKKKK